jgi:hypothetical protein
LRVDGAWFCSDACVAADAARRLREARAPQDAARAPAVRLGAVLRQQGSITEPQLNEALDAQRASGLPLGAQLMQLGHASETNVLRALAAQQGIRFVTSVDAAAVRHAPGGLTGDEVRGLGLVPFRADYDVLYVACAAPVRRAAIAALASLTKRDVEAFLVSDAAFDRLLNGYGAGMDVRSQVAAVRDIRDIEDGAARIATLTAAAGAVTLTQARLDPYTWVRVASRDRTSTLLVPHDPELFESRPADRLRQDDGDPPTLHAKAAAGYQDSPAKAGLYQDLRYREDPAWLAATTQH